MQLIFHIFYILKSAISSHKKAQQKNRIESIEHNNWWLKKSLECKIRVKLI
jgi:hypothetical protein